MNLTNIRHISVSYWVIDPYVILLYSLSLHGIASIVLECYATLSPALWISRRKTGWREKRSRGRGKEQGYE